MPAHLAQDDFETRALLQFAGERPNIQLFKMFRTEFEKGFGTPCGIIGPPQEIAKAVLGTTPSRSPWHPPHRWMTQRHFLDTVAGDQQLDPQFKSLLRTTGWRRRNTPSSTPSWSTRSGESHPNEVATGIRPVPSRSACSWMRADGTGRPEPRCVHRATGRALNRGGDESYLTIQKSAIRWTYLGSG